MGKDNIVESQTILMCTDKKTFGEKRDEKD